jgi:hypothetical protein
VRSKIDGVDMLSLGVGDGDRAVLAKVVGDITSGARLAPEEFAWKAMIWLARQHAYSLRSEISKGEGDPLVRWLVSREPGHCELFAGAFALLARAAGYPARVVTGFMGGTWNKDYLIVRNSDAHAWCEIENEQGEWLRMDPTNDGPRLAANNQSSLAAQANLRTIALGWAARFDRLRMLWYRRIVNFDRGDQLELVRSIEAVTDGSGRRLREWTMHWAGAFRDWLSQPWDSRRWGGLAGACVLAGALGFGGWRYGRAWWDRWRHARGKAIDPVRKRAGFWLRRLDEATHAPGASEVREALARLRYGRRETWPEPERVFAKASAIARGR